jgi:MarR family transcriptional regulator, lower aerobic nicotinate degradation pathway regulator
MSSMPPAEDHPLARIYGAPGHLIRRCQQIAVAVFVDETSAFDLTPVQYAALFVVRALPGVDHTRLVNLIALDRSTVGSVVARLLAKGLIRRKAGAADKRTKRLFPTAAGIALLAAAEAAVDRAQARILAPLAPAERKAFLAMLSRLVDLNNDLSRAPLRQDDRLKSKEKSLHRAAPTSHVTGD